MQCAQVQLHRPPHPHAAIVLAPGLPFCPSLGVRVLQQVDVSEKHVSMMGIK